MPDGQEKSDDLIAELARLMASGASASEPEAKPGPKLVSVPEATPAPVRAAEPAAAARPAGPAPSSPAPAVEPPRAAPVIRIPGMDQPVPSSRAPDPAPAPTSTAAPQPAPSVEPPSAPRPSAVDLGPAPSAEPIRQEPLVSFRMPEAPKSPAPAAPAEFRPSYPTTPAASAPSAPTAAAPAAVEPPKAEAPKVEAPQSAASRDTGAIAGARPQPEGDAFDFDFGFNGDAPEPKAAAEPRPATPPATTTEAVSQPQHQSSGDLIADLIAAELDANELNEASSAPVFSPVPSRPAPVAAPAPPVAAPVASAPMPRATPTAASFGGPASASARPNMNSAPSAPRPASAPAPAVEVDRDPIDEIESLIGEAVRVELGNDRPVPTAASASAPPPRVEPRASTQVPPPAQPAPVVPPLTTGFAPRRAALKEKEINISSAEAAIRAAAAAADSNVELDDEPPAKRPRARREQRSGFSGGMRQYVGMAVAGTLLLAAGFGLFWVLGMGGGSDGDVPVLQADTTPAKQAAPATPEASDTQGNVVFSEIDGSSTAEGEQLVSRDDSTETPIADVARTVGSDGEGLSEGELANRKVRTVTVRPDGTIVSGDEAVAGNEALPVDRPNVPDLPGADVQPSELLATLPTNDGALTSSATPASDDTTSLAAVAPETTTPATGEPVVPGSTVTTASGTVAPIPMPAPNRQALASQVAAAPPAATTPAAAPVSVASGGSGAYAQLSSQPTEADARSALARLQPRVNGAVLEIRQVDLGARGVWYRVVLPTGSFQEATQVCATIKANGNDCLPING